MTAREGGTGRLSISMSPDLVRWVRRKAETEGTTISNVIERALESYKAAVQDQYARTGRR